MRMVSQKPGIDVDAFKQAAKDFNTPVIVKAISEGKTYRDIPKNELRDYLKEVQTEINSKSEEDRDGIPRCSRKHYKNRFEIKPHYKERQGKFSKKFKLKD